MSTQFFGQFLLANGAVTPQQLEAGVSYQRKRNRRLGELAVERAWLTESQANEINTLQRRLDRRFGSLATELGLLSEEQIDELQRYQHSQHIHLGEALVAKELVAEADMAGWLADFERQRSQFGRDVERFLASVPQAALVIPTIDLGNKLFYRVAHLPTLIHGCAIGGVRWPPHPYAVSQRFSGHRKGSLTLTLTEPLLLHIAAKMLNAPVAGVTPLSLDAAAEFLNTLGGHLVTRLPQFELDLEPPMRAPAQADERAICTTLATPAGEAGLHILVE